jgi:hypothetical protein
MNIRRALVLVLLTAALAACAPAPRGRPVKAGPTDTGPGSLEATRRQLEGNWELVSLETYRDGKPVPVKAAGRLTYDAYGNVTTQGVINDPAAGAPSDVLSYSGVIVIDVHKKEWRLTDAQARPGGTAELPADVAADKIRKYEFAGDQLKTSMVDKSGRVTATATWRKIG